MSGERKGKRGRNQKSPPKPRLREKVTEALELPKEIVLDLPKLTMLGNGDLVIENYKGIIEYDSSRIRVNTGRWIIKITGEVLVIKEITAEDIMINGMISSLEFLG